MVIFLTVTATCYCACDFPLPCFYRRLFSVSLTGQRRFANKELKAEKKKHELLLRRMQVIRDVLFTHHHPSLCRIVG
jgi:hypothetical protein